jgi:hypothetical protein
MIKLLKKSKISSASSQYTIYDLLDQETVDRLFDQVTNQGKSKSAGRFSLPDFRTEIPLESVFGKRSIQVLKIRPLSGRASHLFESLIWTALFGSKRFTMVHWYLLYHLFEKQISKNKKSLALLKILLITTERSGSSFNQKLKPVKTIVQSVLGKELALKYIKNLEKDLGIKLPEKDPQLVKQLYIQYGTRIQRKPKEPARIGVGYKDKGTLPKGPKEDTSCSEDYLALVGDLFADLLREAQQETSIFTNYDPQKHEKLLNNLKVKLNKF